MNYCNAKAFTDLFRDRETNRTAIIVMLDQISRGAAARWFRGTKDDKSDAASEALAVCIEKMPEFSFERGGNAFSFFTAIAINAVRRFGSSINKITAVSMSESAGVLAMKSISPARTGNGVRLLTIAEVAARMKRPQNQVWRLCRSGALPIEPVEQRTRQGVIRVDPKNVTRLSRHLREWVTMAEFMAITGWGKHKARHAADRKAVRRRRQKYGISGGQYRYSRRDAERVAASGK